MDFSSKNPLFDEFREEIPQIKEVVDARLIPERAIPLSRVVAGRRALRSESPCREPVPAPKRIAHSVPIKEMLFSPGKYRFFYVHFFIGPRARFPQKSMGAPGPIRKRWTQKVVFFKS